MASPRFMRRAVLRQGATGALNLAVVTLLAACGSTAGPTAVTATSVASVKGAPPTSSLASAASATASVSAQAPATKAATVSVLTADYTTRTQDWFAKTFNPAFTKQAGVQVEMQYAGWGDAFNNKRDTQFASGAAPDIIGSGAVMIVDYSLRGYLRAIDDYLARWPDLADFYPVTLDNTTYQGKRYGLPTRIDARAMLYRTDLMRAGGLDPAHLPVEWDDLKTLSQRLTVKAGDGVSRAGYDLSFGNQQFFPYLWQNGGEVISDDGRQAQFASAQGIEALQYWADLLDTIAPHGTKLPAPPTGESQLQAGIIAAAETGSGVMFTVAQTDPNALSDYAVGLPLKRQQQVINVFPNWHGISSQSKHPDLAWSWLSTLEAKENLLAYDETLSAVPPRQSLATQGFVADPRLQMGKFADVVLHYARPQPLIAAYAQCWTSMDKAITDVLDKKATAQDALNAAAQQWNAAIAQAYANAGK